MTEGNVNKNDNLESLSNADKDYYETLEIKVNESTMTVCRGLFHNVFKRHSCESMQDPYDLIIGFDDYIVPEQLAKKMISSLMIYSFSGHTDAFKFIANDKDILSFYMLLDRHEICETLLKEFRNKAMTQIQDHYNMYVLLAYGYSYGEQANYPAYIKSLINIILGKLDLQTICNVNNGIIFGPYHTYKNEVKIVQKVARLSHLFKQDIGEDQLAIISGITDDPNYIDALQNGFKEVTEISKEAFKYYVCMVNMFTQKISIDAWRCKQLMQKFSNYANVQCNFEPFAIEYNGSSDID